MIFIYKFLLSLRYKVKLKWIENLKHDGPVLLLPNHVALVDPQILISFLSKYLKISPVASEKYYNKPGIKQVMQLIGTVPIWEMNAGADADDVKKVFAKLVEALKTGKNILIYPSGQIYRQWYESIVGKQAVYNICKLMPENTKVIAIRNKWLWGSMWSMAWHNGDTGFFQLLIRSIWIILANMIFFVPKRKVNIEIIDITEQINTYKNMSLNEFNKYLENFYNQEEEKLKFLKHYFYYDDVKNKREPEVIKGSIKELESTKKHDLSEVSEEVKKIIIEKIADMKQINKSLIKDNSKLILDLYFDSLDAAELKSFVQSKFSESSNPPITDLKTVWDIYIMAIGASELEEALKEANWEVGRKWGKNGKWKIGNGKLLIDIIK